MKKERQKAIETGMVRYTSGHPCVNGHLSERYTKSGQCIDCKKNIRLGRRKKLSSEERSEIAANSHKEKRLKLYEEWAAGRLSSPSNRTIRLIHRDIGMYRCVCCGISDWLGKDIVLEVEHKDGNSANGSYENVCLICPNCHSQTPTYKGANRGNGRHYRRNRYAEGKSY